MKFFLGEAFTLNVLCDRVLGGFGEGVKAKNEKSLRIMRARGDFCLHPAAKEKTR